MKNKRKATKWIVLATLCAMLGVGASASAGEVGVTMFEVPGGNTYMTCDWQPVYAETVVISFNAVTTCSVTDFNSEGGWATSYCDTSDTKWVGTSLRTDDDYLCSDSDFTTPGWNSVMCGGDFNLRRNSEWQSCPTYTLASRGYVDRD